MTTTFVRSNLSSVTVIIVTDVQLSTKIASYTRRNPLVCIAGKYVHGSVVRTMTQVEIEEGIENRDGTEIDQRRVPPMTHVSMKTHF